MDPFTQPCTHTSHMHTHTSVTKTYFGEDSGICNWKSLGQYHLGLYFVILTSKAINICYTLLCRNPIMELTYPKIVCANVSRMCVLVCFWDRHWNVLQYHYIPFRNILEFLFPRNWRSKVIYYLLFFSRICVHRISWWLFCTEWKAKKIVLVSWVAFRVLKVLPIQVCSELIAEGDLSSFKVGPWTLNSSEIYHICVIEWIFWPFIDNISASQIQNVNFYWKLIKRKWWLGIFLMQEKSTLHISYFSENSSSKTTPIVHDIISVVQLFIDSLTSCC